MPVSHEAWPLPVSSIDSFSYADLSLDATLEDLASRFIFNIPEWERNSMERVGFQVESAHWYYEDFVREQNTRFPTCSLKRFFGMLWGAVPLLNEWHEMHEEAFDRFVAYKGFVPVCGAIILNEACDKVLLVKGWKNSAGWGFPKGKINQNEATMACAIREVLEETGYNIKPFASEEDCISVSIYSQVITLYIVHPVPEDTVFETRTRKEISRIEWFKLVDLPGWGRARVPGKFFLINPFMQNLKSWVSHHKREIQLHESNQHNATLSNTAPKKTKKAKERPTHAKPGNRVSFQGFDHSRSNGSALVFEDQNNYSDTENTPENTSEDLLESLLIMQAGSRSSRSTPANPRASSSSDLSSGMRSTNQSAGPSPELPRISNSAQPPTLNRSQTDYRERKRENSMRTPRSSISSASSMSISPVEAKHDVSKQARDLLDAFSQDATRQTPSNVSREQLSRPHPVTIPSTMPNPNPTPGSLSGYFKSPDSDAAALMAAFRRPGAPESPLTPMVQSVPPNIGHYHNVTPIGFAGPNGAAFYPGMMPNSLSYGARPPVGMHMNINHLSRTQQNGHPLLSYPVQSFPYRPSSVPLQEATTHDQAHAPTQVDTGVSTTAYPSLVAPSPAHSSNARMSPAASIPRNVPHAPQLLALFHDPPSVS